MSLLILGGTGEARVLARCLRRLPGARVSLAGATVAPKVPDLPSRRGGFGGAEGFARYLSDEGISAVLDATHPFAVQITARSRAVCDRRGVPYRQILRPAWTPEPGDNWVRVADAAGAVAAIPRGARVFLATGRQSLPEFAGLDHARVLARVIDPPDAPFPFPCGGYVVGRPPFSVSDEVRLLREADIDWMVTKNSGGAKGRAKLQAARRLRLPVVMIDRPQGAPDRGLGSLRAALDWVAGGCPP